MIFFQKVQKYGFVCEKITEQEWGHLRRKGANPAENGI